MPRYLQLYRALWGLNPYLVASVVSLLGIIPFLLVVQGDGPGSITYYMSKAPEAVCDAPAYDAGKCFVKQVGYLYALNWWPALIALFPLALFFAFESVQNTVQVTRRMIKEKMLAAVDWSGAADNIDEVIVGVWKRFAIAGLIIFVLVFFLMYNDWSAVVDCPYKVNTPLGSVTDRILRDRGMQDVLDQLTNAGCATGDNQENDWSVSAVFNRDFGPRALAVIEQGHPWAKLSNEIFSAYNYFIAAIWTGGLLAYYSFIVVIALAVVRLNQGERGPVLVLNLKSEDPRKRRGFEDLEPILAPSIYVTIIAFMMAFMMRVQNVYLRDRSAGDIFQFLFGDVSDSVSQMLKGEFKREIIIKLLNYDELSDPQSLMGAPAILIVFSLSGVVLAYVLRYAAMSAQTRTLKALEDETTAKQVAAYYGLEPDEALKRARDIQTWPLSWPELRRGLAMLGLGVFCYIFYKFAIAWVLVVAIQSLRRYVSGGADRAASATH